MKKLLILALVALLPFAVSAQKKDAKDSKTEQTETKKDAKSSAKDSKSSSKDAKSSSNSKGGSGQIVKSVTVEQAKKDVAHFSTIIIEGQLTHQIGDRDFVLTDSTGSVKLELTGETEYYADGEILLGSTVRVLGVVKKRLWDDTVIEGVKLKVINPSSVGGF